MGWRIGYLIGLGVGYYIGHANADQLSCAPTIRTSYAQSHEIKLDMVAEQNARTGTFHTLGEYELDHIVPLCMGGSNDRSNLQLQTWDDAKRKDIDEVALCQMVRSGVLSCQEAQQTMQTWK